MGTVHLWHTCILECECRPVNLRDLHYGWKYWSFESLEGRMWMMLYCCSAPPSSNNCKFPQACITWLFCSSFWLMGSPVLQWLQTKGQKVILILGELELMLQYFLFLWHWELLACFFRTSIFNSLLRYLETGTAINYIFWGLLNRKYPINFCIVIR